MAREGHLRTERLILRRWRDSDLEPFARMNADPAVTEFLPAALDRAASGALAERICAHFEARGYGLWAVEVTGGPAFIGFTGLADVGFEAAFAPGVEIGWRLARDAWGKGYATEAARAALAFGFGPASLPEILSFTTVTNRRSRAVMDRIGMTRDESGEFDHPALPPGHPLRRHVLYRIPRPHP